MAHYSGKNGGVFSGALLVENCEDSWNEYTNANVTPSVDSSDYKVGTASAKFVVGINAGTNERIGTEVISKNLASYDTLYAWVKSSVALTAGDWQVLLDDSTECATPLKNLNIPALAAGTWAQVALDLGDASGLTSLISIGLKQVVDKGAMNFWIDDVEAITEVDGVKSWSLDYVLDTLETTDFASAGAKEYEVGDYGWSGSFEGLKDGVPLSIGSDVILVLYETQTTGQSWLGHVFITGVHPSVSVDSTVNYSYDFIGNGALQAPLV